MSYEFPMADPSPMSEPGPCRLERAETEVERLQAEVERLRRECDDLEAIVGNYRTALLWIVAHDQTMRPNGGDPEWFAEEAPYRARKALAE